MTTDLDRLIEAVEAETATMHHFASVFPSESAYGRTIWGTAHNAFSGSLDAAVKLHEELLPGWNWGRMNDRMFVEQGDSVFSARGHNPARALLLATLRAYRSTRDGE